MSCRLATNRSTDSEMTELAQYFSAWTGSKIVVVFAGALVGLLSGFWGATTLAYLKAFSDVKGHNSAVLRDLEQLQQQLRENTEITRKVDQSYSREDFLWKSELEFREKQLANFYGPAYGYVMTQRDIFGLWFDQKMPEVNHEVKKLLSKQNNLLRQLIIENSHLIEGPQMPTSFVRFCASTLASICMRHLPSTGMYLNN